LSEEQATQQLRRHLLRRLGRLCLPTLLHLRCLLCPLCLLCTVWQLHLLLHKAGSLWVAGLKVQGLVGVRRS
jgi:hypothetical protein